MFLPPRLCGRYPPLNAQAFGSDNLRYNSGTISKRDLTLHYYLCFCGIAIVVCTVVGRMTTQWKS
jgi:hypothetical protein